MRNSLFILFSFFALTSCQFNTANLTNQTDPIPTPQNNYVTDDFNDDSMGPLWILGSDPASLSTMFFAGAGTPPPISETGHQLVMEEPITDWRGNAFETVGDYDMTDKWFAAEMVQAPVDDPLRYREAGVWMMNLSGDGWEMFKSAGSLYMGTFLHDQSSDQTTIAFDAILHRFLRMRHDSVGDTIEFETSPDGDVWTSHRSMLRDPGIPILQTKLLIYSYGSNNGNGVSGTPIAIFDNFVTNAIAN